MPLIILHDLENEEVAVNTDCINAAMRKHPGADSMMKEPFTKLYYVTKDKGIDAVGFPELVKETPAEIVKLAAKAAK